MERGWPSGPRLPISHPIEDHDPLLADPGKGQRRVRCRTCGMPSTPGGKLLTFDLTLAGKRAGQYRLCERCWMVANADNPLVRGSDPIEVTG